MMNAYVSCAQALLQKLALVKTAELEAAGAGDDE